MTTHVQNPEDLTAEEKQYWKELSTLFNDLLNELKGQNLIRTSFNKTEIDSLIKMVNDSNKVFESYNALSGLFGQNNRSKEFAKVTTPFGVTASHIPYIWLTMAISTFIVATEQFKNSFLLILKKGKDIRKDLTLGQMIGKLASLAPRNGPNLGNHIKHQLRNSLSHGLFWLEPNGYLAYSKDVSFNNIDKMRLDTFIMTAKRHNIVFQSFFRMVADKVSEGFFR